MVREDVKDNLNLMTKEWQSHQRIEMLVVHIEDGTAFTCFAWRQMDTNMLVDSFLNIIKAMGQYQTYYKE